MTLVHRMPSFAPHRHTSRIRHTYTTDFYKSLNENLNLKSSARLQAQRTERSRGAVWRVHLHRALGKHAAQTRDAVQTK